MHTHTSYIHTRTRTHTPAHTQDMSYNNLSKIPEELLKSKSLIVLDLGHNRLSTIPGAVSHTHHTPHTLV